MENDKYELFEIYRNPIRSVLLSAMELAKKFIIERNLIITGGMAIDFALRNMGDQLYNPESLNGVVPDYDCYSPDPVKDAYDFTELLQEQGYSNDGLYRLDAIRAKHIQTIRVRIEYKSIVEISYIPPKIFNNLPKIKYQDMLVIHPHWQLINIHRSLSYPVIDPPFESLFNRLNKDVERFMMLYSKYPLKTEIYTLPQNKINIVKIIDELSIMRESTNKTKQTDNIRISTYNFLQGIDTDIKFNEDLILYGFSAYPFYYIKYLQIINSFKKLLGDQLTDSLDGIHNSNISFNDEYKFDEIQIPLNEISFITSNTKLINALETKDDWMKYEPFLDYILEHYKKSFNAEYTVSIYYLYNTYISISKIEFNNTYVNVTNVNNTLTYLLCKYNTCDNENKNIYLTFYTSLVNMIKKISSYLDMVVEKYNIDDSQLELGISGQSSEIKKIFSIVLDSPFFISKKLYGKYNKSESYLYSELYQYKRILLIKQNANIDVDPNQIYLPSVPERSYQPGLNVRPIDFDYNKSVFFKISGEEIS